jgi:chaperonin GroEL
MKSSQKPGVLFQPDVHRTLQRGIAKIVNALRPTLGPVSCGVAIDRMYSAKTLPEYVDEGGVIARRIIELDNRDEDVGAMLVRSMVIRQHERIGDGTATAAVLFDAIFKAGLRYIAAGGNPMQFRRYLESALPLILDELDRMVTPLDGQTALTGMAWSLCHDEGMAALLGEAFDLLGAYGTLDIREDYGRGLRREYVEGTYFHGGLISRALMLDESASKVTFEDAAVFLCDFEVQEYHDLFPVLQAANAVNVKQLVIIVRSLSDKAVSLLVTQNKLNRFKVMAVQLPGQNPTERMEALEDLSLLTGAAPLITAAGDTLENVTSKPFGQARRLWADSRMFGLVGGGGDPRRLRQHIQKLKTAYHNTQEVDGRKRTQARIGRLLGGAVTLWVGGFTETEINARKSLAQRAALTMRTAVEGGVVPGGGVALLNCRTAVEKRLAQANDSDERAVYHILHEALAVPARTIIQNAGYDPSEVMAQLLHQGADMGFDVTSNRVVNLREAGILDSALVVKASLRNAISTAGMALTIDSVVHLARPEIAGRPE